MAGNSVVVTISAKDQLTGAIKGIRGQLGGMSGNLNGISNQIGGLTSGFLGMAAGIATAAVAALGLKNAIGESAKIETSLITSAGDVATLMGVKYEDALTKVKDVQKEIAKMAAALPGETAGYAAIGNAITGGIAGGAGGDLKVFEHDLLSVTKTLGLLAATKNVDMNMAASASVKFVSGAANLSELFAVNDVFQKNQLFKKYLLDALKDDGKTEKDWKKIEQSQRNKIIDIAGRKAFTEETLAKLTTTADNYIQTMKTNLFDPQIGIFGFLREIGELGKDEGGNIKTGLSGVKELLVGVMKLSKAASYFGTVDPMIVFYKFFSSLGKMATDVAAIIDKGGTIYKNITEYFIKGTTDALNNLTKAIQKVDWGQLGFDLGANIGRILTDDKLGIALEKAITSALEGLSRVIVQAIRGAGEQLTKQLNGNSDFRSIVPGGIGETEGEARARRGLKNLPTDSNMYFPGKDGQYIDPNTLKPIPAIPPSNSTSNKSTNQASAVININGATGDNQQLAQLVMDKLNGMWQDRTNAALA